MVLNSRRSVLKLKKYIGDKERNWFTSCGIIISAHCGPLLNIGLPTIVNILYKLAEILANDYWWLLSEEIMMIERIDCYYLYETGAGCLYNSFFRQLYCWKISLTRPYIWVLPVSPVSRFTSFPKIKKNHQPSTWNTIYLKNPSKKLPLSLFYVLTSV